MEVCSSSARTCRRINKRVPQKRSTQGARGATKHGGLRGSDAGGGPGEEPVRTRGRRAGKKSPAERGRQEEAKTFTEWVQDLGTSGERRALDEAREGQEGSRRRVWRRQQGPEQEGS